jgi:hypothetical protein
MNLGKILLVVVCLGGAAWLYKYLTMPQPGVAIEDQGRQHVSSLEVANTVYKSNPPTSGPHLETWVKPGVYSDPQREGELIHSLEHGYVNINYNCNPVAPGINDATASGKMQSADSARNDTPECKTLVSQLDELARKKKLFKLLVVPRPQLDAKIALVAWNHIDKFDTFDAKRIEAFIDYWRDHGPEQTME